MYWCRKTLEFCTYIASLGFDPSIHHTGVVFACEITCTLTAMHISVVGSGRLLLRLVSAASRQLSRDWEEGERSGGVGGSFRVQGPLARLKAHDPSQPKTPALLMWFPRCSHICHSSATFFFFDSTRFRLWIFYFALVDVNFSVQVLVVRSFTHLPGAFCLIPILNTIQFE